MALGIPSALMLCLEWWSFEIMILIAGYIGVDEQASQFLVIQITDLLLMVAFGLQQAASSCIGQQIGKGDVTSAREFKSLLDIIGLTIFLTITIITYLNKSFLI